MNFSEEYQQIKNYDYNQLIEFLKNKYGDINESYFIKPNCKSINKRIKRGNEGLDIHHIMECKVILLNNKTQALNNPWEYQLGKNLVYANFIEHSLLHAVIHEEFDPDGAVLGLGFFGLQSRFLKDAILHYKFKRQYYQIKAKLVNDNLEIVKEVWGRAGFEIETDYDKLIEDEKEYQKQRLQRLKKYYLDSLNYSHEFLEIKDRSSKNLSRKELIGYMNNIRYKDYRNAGPNYINFTRDKIIDELDTMANTLINTDSFDDYLKLINN
ncbi:hypothetical protein [Fructilactobacillus cliffordii]|uniref:Uncharacterized protein n=1 Tax=Fructilactobacillus cliffordii TaxID=2940299 RepID=A0A9Q9E1K6_9LACO|nr:hypothetical protein [Fructilactobacillus cliffordii]USS88835.1 hypothetical protein M3M40_04935 [Fructilactobacillus cliffordii]